MLKPKVQTLQPTERALRYTPMMQTLPRALTHVVPRSTGSPALLGPVRIVLDDINAPVSQTAFNSYEESGKVPHITLDPFRKETWQHIGLEMSAARVSNPPVEPHRMGRTIWVNVMKTEALNSEQSFWVGQQVAAIAYEVGCVDYWMSFPSEFSSEYRTSQLSLGLWKSFEGICGAAHVPHTQTNGPGAMDLEAFAEGLVAGSSPTITTTITTEVPMTVHVVEAEEVESVTVVHEPDVTESVLGEFPGRKVKLGSGGKAVAALREAYGLDKGKFDEELLEFVLDAQNAAGMTTDGIVDRETWEAIAEDLRGK